MQSKAPFRDLLALTREKWQTTIESPTVRNNFSKVLACRTPALGAEVYASANEKKIVFHTCKSKCCPSCGNRATLLWQREQWAMLPDIPFVGIVLTMPDVLWPLFKGAPRLQHDLPALGAAAIKNWAWAKYRVRLCIMVIQHTFGGHLNYNPHLHMMVSGAGLDLDKTRWVHSLAFDREEIMALWRLAVIEYLEQAYCCGSTLAATPDLSVCLRGQASRRWNISVTPHMSKAHFLRYAGRYIRRLPISQRRILSISAEEVVYQSKDTRTKSFIEKRCTPEQFVDLIAQHVPGHYRHSMRYFGLLAPTVKARIGITVFALSNSTRRSKPKRQSWTASVQKHFGRDPLRDANGLRMRWIGSLPPASAVGRTPLSLSSSPQYHDQSRDH
jgi:Putative transposase/Transposase zinc-binding domain